MTDGDFTLQQPDNFLKLEGLNLSVPEIRNGQDLRASLRTRLYGEQVTSETLHRLNGQINGTLDLTLSPELLPQSLAMTAQSTLESPDSEIPAMDFKLETRTELDLQNQKISVHSLFAQALQGDAPILQVELDQALHVNYQQLPPQISDAALTLSVPPLQIKDLPFAPWIPLKKGEISLQSTWEVSDSGRRLQAKIDFATQQLEIPAEKTSQTITLDQAEGSVGIFWTTGKDPQVEATLHTRYIQLQDGIRLPSPLKIGLKGSGSLTGATLEKAEIQWQQIPGFENRLTVSGSADWTVRDAMNVEMYLSAQSLELNSWKDFLIQKPQPDPSGSEPGPGRETDSTSAWKLPTLPFEKLMLDVEIGKVHFSEVMLQAVRLKLDAEKQSLILQPFSLVLNQSEINQTLNLDWTNGIHVTTEGSISPLDLQPVIDSFYPEKRGVIMGMLQGSTAFSTNGTSGESMRRNLSGQLDLSYTQGKIRLLDSNPDQQTALFHTRKLVQDIVTALAGALNLSPEKLMAPEIESVILSSRIKDQHLQLERGRIENPEFLMEMQGEIALSPVVGDSELDSIPVILGVST
ncbi:MAG: AsmA-like C-terminal region-containing protein, partial [Kiritimatiellia bacterium]